MCLIHTESTIVYIYIYIYTIFLKKTKTFLCSETLVTIIFVYMEKKMFLATANFD